MIFPGIKVLSLFDGMSCGQMALDKLGIEVGYYYASEIDKFAIKVARDNYPDMIHIGDVTAVKGENRPKIDLLLGGSPCTNFSISGNLDGMTTSENIEILTLEDYLKYKELGYTFNGQSYLFWEYMRLLKECKPTYFLLENVIMPKKWEAILSEAIGCKPIRINSNLVSCQNRDRLYWTNIPNITIPEDRGIVLRRDGILAHAWSKSVRKDGSFDERIRVDGKINCLTKSHGGTESITFLPPHNIDFAPRKVWDKADLYYKQIQKEWKMTAAESRLAQNIPSSYIMDVSDNQIKNMLGNGWTVDVIAHILKELPYKRVWEDL